MIFHQKFYLHEKARLEVFAKLEPESDRENKIHPEWYGKWCILQNLDTEYPEEFIQMW